MLVLRSEIAAIVRRPDRNPMNVRRWCSILASAVFWYATAYLTMHVLAYVVT